MTQGDVPSRDGKPQRFVPIVLAAAGRTFGVYFGHLLVLDYVGVGVIANTPAHSSTACRGRQTSPTR